jgi:SpoVK/Ycf46/Vps4 family AAA+-type ATPase
VSYLLQRVEDFPGLVVLATNFPANLDDAFGRRFQAVLHFQKPDYGQRLRLWQAAFTPPLTLHPEVNLEKIAYDYEITGGAILNVLRYCALKALERGDTRVLLPELLHAIRKELHKEGKTVV